MTSEEFRDHISFLGLTQGQAASFFGLGLRTVNNYCNSRAPIPKSVDMLLRLMVHRRIYPVDLAGHLLA